MNEKDKKGYNVVIIISDQHKRSAMGHSGHPMVKTPHLDALAASGVSFTSAYCSSPVCAPTGAQSKAWKLGLQLQVVCCKLGIVC